jgi:hypothetical protein
MLADIMIYTKLPISKNSFLFLLLFVSKADSVSSFIELYVFPIFPFVHNNFLPVNSRNIRKGWQVGEKEREREMCWPCFSAIGITFHVINSDFYISLFLIAYLLSICV